MKDLLRKKKIVSKKIEKKKKLATLIRHKGSFLLE